LLLLNKAKMSKSTGNFLTLRKAIELYGADATRFALASAGDGLEDANFVTDTADKTILRLYKEEQWAVEVMGMIESGTGVRTGELTFWDKYLLNEISMAAAESRTFYEQMKLLDVCRTAFHNMVNARDVYRAACAESDMPLHADVVRQWLEAFVIMNSPICPFWTQFIWSKVLKYSPENGHEEFVCNARYPVPGEYDPLLERKVRYIRTTASNIVKAKSAALTARAKKNPSDKSEYTKLTIRVASRYHAWQEQVLTALKQMVDESEVKEGYGQLADNNQARERLRPLFEQDKKVLQTALSWSAKVREEYAKMGPEVLELAMPFNEAELLREHVGLLVRNVNIEPANVVIEQLEPVAGQSVPAPGKPQFLFE